MIIAFTLHVLRVGAEAWIQAGLLALLILLIGAIGYLFMRKQES